MEAIIHTTKGDIKIKLFHEKVPKTVENFVKLATEGVDKYPDRVPFYTDIKFHRVIDDFMIQTGCPLGTGTGDAGYKFKDEFGPGLKHSKAGILSMANSGPNTNGSQFFITLAPCGHLDGAHSVFGEVIEGMDVVKAIGSSDTTHGDRPVEDILLKNIDIFA
jgi:peptidyl-prolyl cis-trans isomerase A (cyclophilin A)